MNRWFCSNCKWIIEDFTRGGPCPGCGKKIGVEVDLYCEHGMAIDMACNECGRGGFRFVGINDGGKKDVTENQE